MGEGLLEYCAIFTPIDPLFHHHNFSNCSFPLIVRRTGLRFHNLSDDEGMQHMKDFVAAMETPQRNILGFPPVGHRYWTPQSIAAVGDRYTGIDMADYEQGLSEGGARL